MRFLVKKTPDKFIRTVNDEISSLLSRHFDSYFPEAAYLEELDKLSMPVELEDKGKNFVIKAELPGIKKEDLDIDLDKNYMTINAKKEEKTENEEENSYKKSEFRYGEFSRTIYFPEEIDVEKANAKLDNGILCITVDKKSKEKEDKRKLTIE